MSAKHTFIITLGWIVIIGWVIQLARWGDPVGMGILLWVGAIITILALAISAAIWKAGGHTRVRGEQFNDLHRAFNDQARSFNKVTEMVVDVASQPPPAPINNYGASQQFVLPPPSHASLGPGQLMTREGFVIDTRAFAALDSQAENERNGSTLIH